MGVAVLTAFSSGTPLFSVSIAPVLSVSVKMSLGVSCVMLARTQLSSEAGYVPKPSTLTRVNAMSLLFSPRRSVLEVGDTENVHGQSSNLKRVYIEKSIR